MLNSISAEVRNLRLCDYEGVWGQEEIVERSLEKEGWLSCKKISKREELLVSLA